MLRRQDTAPCLARDCQSCLLLEVCVYVTLFYNSQYMFMQKSNSSIGQI